MAYAVYTLLAVLAAVGLCVKDPPIRPARDNREAPPEVKAAAARALKRANRQTKAIKRALGRRAR